MRTSMIFHRKRDKKFCTTFESGKEEEKKPVEKVFRWAVSFSRKVWTKAKCWNQKTSKSDKNDRTWTKLHVQLHPHNIHTYEWASYQMNKVDAFDLANLFRRYEAFQLTFASSHIEYICLVVCLTTSRIKSHSHSLSLSSELWRWICG